MAPKKVIATDAIEMAVNSSSSDRMAISDLIGAMNGAGFGLAIMIFAFGVAIPLPPPAPGIISIPLVIFSVQMMRGLASPKLPKRFANLTIKRSVLATLVRKAFPYINKVEKILRPRLLFMTSVAAERFIGFFIFLFATFILLPMPLSNFIPGVGILIISFGLVAKDGLAVILGIIIGTLGLAISITAVLLGVEALHYIANLF